MAPPTVIMVHFTPAEMEVITRPIRAQRDGTLQRVLRRIVGRLNIEKRSCPVYPQDIVEAKKLAAKYAGGGGYQGRYSVIVTAYDRAVGWEEAKNGSRS